MVTITTVPMTKVNDFYPLNIRRPVSCFRYLLKQKLRLTFLIIDH